MNKIERLEGVFKLQKDHYSPANPMSYEKRMAILNKMDTMFRTHYKEITSVLQEDFGYRGRDLIFTAEFYPILSHISHVKKHLKRWMRKERTTSLGMALTGQREYIVNEALGVVGIMSPFNAPVSLAFDPAIEAIAGGNRVILKLSESTPKTAAFMTKLVSQYFKETELACVDGNLEVSKKFASLAWDKFFFTGGSEVGKKILGAAADNLTPVILELGGKSPCIVLGDADIKAAARKIGQIRVMNSGQVCISGDYAFVPENDLESFLSHAVGIVEEKYPTIIHNKDYTAIIDDRNYQRIVGYIDEAKAAGVRIIQANAGGEKLPDPKTRKIPLTVVVNPPMDLQVAKYEIFGPVLTVITYQSLDQVIKTINANEKPLALYVFGKNRSQINKVIKNTSSGGVTVNDLLMHADASKMGFGGVGYSGMGRYKGGKIGFMAFTNPKGVVESGLMRKFTDVFQPPYASDRSRKMLRNMVGLKE